jgi:phage baseplate assembly protein W
MPNYSPKLPLALDQKGGYEMLNTLGDVVKQNLKMLVLTMPGERMMMPNFGAGLYKFFFEPMIPSTFGSVRNSIFSQTKKYMPYVTINSVEFLTSDIDNTLSDTAVRIVVRYSIPTFNSNDVLDFEVNYAQK